MPPPVQIRVVESPLWLLLLVFETAKLTNKQSLMSNLFSANRVSRVLSTRLAVKVGDWSYSIYLWHWPVIVFLGWISTNFRPVVAILASVAAGFASHRWIEQPFRRGLGWSRWLALGSVVAAGFATILLLAVQGALLERADRRLRESPRDGSGADVERALAAAGHDTHLWFVGDPGLPGNERHDRLHLHRWCHGVHSLPPAEARKWAWR